LTLGSRHGGPGMGVRQAPRPVGCARECDRTSERDQGDQERAETAAAGSVTSEDAAGAATVFWVGVTLSGERRSCEAGVVGVTLSGGRRSCDAAATWTRAAS